MVNLEQFIPAARQVKDIGRVGRRMCAHCTAAGKVMLAYLPSAKLDKVLVGELLKFTVNTITDPDELRQELAQARERGYALAREELEDGLNAVAAPIYDHSGQAVAAVSISGPAYRVPPDTFSHLAGQLVKVADRISQQLGYV